MAAKSEKNGIKRQVVDVDNLLEHLRPKGRFQVTQYVLLSSSFLACAASFLKLVFVAYVPEVNCSNLTDSQLNHFGYDSNSTQGILYKRCEIEIFNRNTSQNETHSCLNGYTYAIEKHMSFVSEWDLVCEKEAMSELSQTLYAFGCFIGAFIVPIFSDKFGRKPAHFVSFLLLLINQMVLAAVDRFWLFVLLRVTEGAFNYGMVMPAYSAMLELFPGSTRTFFAAFIGVIWGFSMLLITPLAYICRNQTWRIVCVAFGAVSATFLFEFWFVEESIRWLITNNKMDATRKIVKRAARENKVNFEEVWDKCVETYHRLIPQEEKFSKEEEVKKAEDEVVNLGVMTLVKDPLIRNISCILVFNALMNSFTYYGIYMTAAQLAGNYYLNFLLTSSMEILGNITMLFMLRKFQRRTTMLFFQMFSGFCLIASVIINYAVSANAATAVANKIFTLFGMFGISASFCVIWLYAPEVYPTNLRNSGLGLMGMGSALGNMIAPLTRYTARQIAWLPATIFGVGNILGSMLIFILPETKNIQMPTTMADVRALKKNNKKHKNIETYF